MTVTATTNQQRFNGGGTVGPFSWNWRFLANSDIEVYRIADPGDTEELVLLTEGVDYTLTGARTYTGGVLNLTDALSVGEDLEVQRHTRLTQTTSLRNQGNNFFPETHEDVFDALTMMLQDLNSYLVQQTEAILASTTAQNQAIQSSVDAQIAALQSGVDAQVGALTAQVAALTTLAATNRVTLYDSTAAPEAFILADASAGNILVTLPDADDPSAKLTTVIKDASDNVVTLTVEAGTIMGVVGIDLTIPDEPLRLFPNAAANNWVRC